MFGIFKKKFVEQVKIDVSVDSGAIVIYDPFNLKHRVNSDQSWLINYADSTFVRGKPPVNAMFPNLHKYIEISELNDRLVSIIHLEGDGGYDFHVSVGFEAIAEIVTFYSNEECHGIINDILHVNSKEIFIGDFAYVPGDGWQPNKNDLPNGGVISLDNGTYRIHQFNVLDYTEDDVDDLLDQIEHDEDCSWTKETMDRYFQIREQLSSFLIVFEKVKI